MATLAAMNLAGMTAAARAHTSNDPANTRHRPLGRVEFPATGDHPVASREQPTANATVRRLLTAVLALVAGVAVVAARRATRSQRAGQTV